jgi:hypothetical protein
MSIDFLLQEDGSQITLEDGSGSIILESSGAIFEAGPDVFVMINSNADLETFVYGSEDSKIYLNSTQDIDLLT